MEKGDVWLRFFSSAVAESFDGIAIADLNYKLIFVNPAWVKMHGYNSSEELIGKSVVRLNGLEQTAKGVEPFMQVVKDKGKKTIEMRHFGKDGTPFNTLTTIKLLKDDQETPLAILCIVRDITKRKLVDDLLQESELKYQNLVETSSDWVWEVDKDGRYTYVSPRIKNLLGYEPEEVLGKSPFDLMPPEEAERLKNVFIAAVSLQEPFNSLENTNIHKDGHPVVLETSGLPFFDPEGNFSGYRGIDRDITARKQAEQKLLDQSKNLQETNIALRVILRESEITKKELEENMLSNIKDLMLPYLVELESSNLTKEQQFFLDIIKANISEITSSFSKKLQLELNNLTPREIQVADLIRQGRTNKEIARLLNITTSAVDFHRRNLRKKFKIKGQKANLRSHLLSFVV